MGYQSDAALKLKTELFEKFEKFMKNADESSWEFLLAATRSEEDECTTLYWEGLKFYMDYSEISNLYQFLEETDPEDFGFIRIGEDYDDYEERGSPLDFGMYVSRHIYF